MNRHSCFDEKIIFMVRMYARRLFNKRVLRSMEVEDIEQELMLEVFKSLKSYKAHLGSMESFLGTVIKNSAKELLMKSFCLKRGGKTVFEEFIEDFHTDTATSIDVEKIIEAIDFSRAVKCLPTEKRTLCKLAGRHSITDISKILGVNRTTLYSRLKVITRIIGNSRNSFRSSESLTTLEDYMKDISLLEKLSAKEISALDVCDLMDLNNQIIDLGSHVKTMKEKFDDGLNLRFAETVRNTLRSSGKDTGTTRFLENGFQIIAEVPKKVTWDSEKMESILKQVPEEKRKAIVKISYAIDERKYAELSYEYQLLFKDARTVTPGKTRFQIQTGDQA